MRDRPSQLRRYWNLFRNVRNPLTYLRFKAGLHGGDPLVFALLHGVRVRVPASRVREFKSVIMNNSYFRGFRRGVLEDRRGVTILDVGANLGFFSLYAASRCRRSRVIAVEPLPANFTFLTDNLAANGACESLALNVALGGERGTLRLHAERDEEFPTGASVFGGEGRQGPSFEVPTLPLADLMAKYDVPEVHFLKLDCEGSEYAVLYSCPGGTLARVHNIALEVHRGTEPEENAAGLERFLSAHGFTVRVAADQHYIWASRDPGSVRRA